MSSEVERLEKDAFTYRARFSIKFCPCVKFYCIARTVLQLLGQHPQWRIFHTSSKQLVLGMKWSMRSMYRGQVWSNVRVWGSNRSVRIVDRAIGRRPESYENFQLFKLTEVTPYKNFWTVIRQALKSDFFFCRWYSALNSHYKSFFNQLYTTLYRALVGPY